MVRLSHLDNKCRRGGQAQHLDEVYNHAKCNERVQWKHLSPNRENQRGKNPNSH